MNDPLEKHFGDRIDPELDMEKIDPLGLFEDLLIALRQNCPDDTETISFVQGEYQRLSGGLSDG